MIEPRKLKGGLATYIVGQHTTVKGKLVDEHIIDKDEAARMYSKLENVPISMNLMKRQEIVAIAKEYLAMKQDIAAIHSSMNGGYFAETGGGNSGGDSDRGGETQLPPPSEQLRSTD